MADPRLIETDSCSVCGKPIGGECVGHINDDGVFVGRHSACKPVTRESPCR